MYYVEIDPNTDAFTAYEQAYRAGKALRQSAYATDGQEKDFLHQWIEVPYSRHRQYSFIRTGFLAGLRGEALHGGLTIK
jgi:hypothetical protein